jgi:hypothetical protein
MQVVHFQLSCNIMHNYKWISLTWMLESFSIIKQKSVYNLLYQSIIYIIYQEKK